MIKHLTINTPGQGLHEFTDQLSALVRDAGVREGLCTLFVQHTSASLLIQENADPSAKRDLEHWLNRLVQENFVGNKIWRASARPEGEGQDGPSQNDPLYTHQNEGPDDMPGHIKSALTATQISIPISEGRLALGTWQGVYLWEHRHRGGARRLVVHIGA
ncbi:MAG: YjbQ family protein [Sulfuricaulis sp.]|nr:YjbQ family protein [Sulfuricaulis sp.]